MLRVLSLSEVWKLFFLSAMLMIPHFKTCVHTQKYIHICIILPASKEFPCPCFKTINISVYKATLLTEEHWNISLVFQSNLLGFINSFQQGCLRKRFMRPIVKQKLVLNSMYTSWKSYQLQKELKKKYCYSYSFLHSNFSCHTKHNTTVHLESHKFIFHKCKQQFCQCWRKKQPQMCYYMQRMN